MTNFKSSQANWATWRSINTVSVDKFFLQTFNRWWWVKWNLHVHKTLFAMLLIKMYKGWANWAVIWRKAYKRSRLGQNSHLNLLLLYLTSKNVPSHCGMNFWLSSSLLSVDEYWTGVFVHYNSFTIHCFERWEQNFKWNYERYFKE